MTAHSDLSHLKNASAFFFDDQVLSFNGVCYTGEEAHILFLMHLADAFQKVTFAARVRHQRDSMPFPVDHQRYAILELPDYKDLTDWLKRPLRNTVRLIAALRRNPHTWDFVLVSWPNPVSFLILLWLKVARPRAAPCVAVRQNLRELVRVRYTGMRRLVGMGIADALDLLLKLLFKKACVFTVGSEMYAKYQKTFTNIHLVKFPVISNTHTATASLSSKFAQLDPIRLIFVGRLEPEKRLDCLLDALVLLRSCHVKFSLDIIGKGWLEDDLKKQAARNGIEDSVHFRGFVPFGPELFEWYRASHALLITSSSEGFPKVIFEAMVFGLVVVSTDVGGIREVIKHQVNGLLIVPESADAICQAISYLHKKPEEALRLATASCEAVQTQTIEYHSEVVLQALATIYHDAL